MIDSFSSNELELEVNLFPDELLLELFYCVDRIDLCTFEDLNCTI
jgi:hypothetical protein